MVVGNDILKKLVTQFHGENTFTYDELCTFLKIEFPEIAEKTISWHIYKLKKDGVITHISRGIYSLKKKDEYIPELSLSLKKIFNKIQTNLPFLNLCVWDSRWFNEFMVHQLFKFYLVVETEKDAINSVFNNLVDTNNNVYLNPDSEIYNRYIVNQDEVIIVKPLVSEAPLTEIDKIAIPTIEKLLIDCLIDKDLFAAQQDELENIYQTVFEKYIVNLNKSRRYARRRDRLVEFEDKLIKLNLNH